MNGGARINLSDAWPISDEEGRSLTGYTFTIENKCDDSVNYIIALESLESTKGLEYLNNNYVKLAIDDEIEKRYGLLDTIENVVLENDPETIRETKEVTTSTVAGNSINEHTIRIWLSEDAPLTEQNKVFASRVRITGGQGVENTNVPATADSCFEIDENGEILGYDESCGESVVIPARVNGTPVKTIDSNAFKEESTLYNYSFVNVFDSSWNLQNTLVINPSEEANIRQWANDNGYGSMSIELYDSSMTFEDGQQFQYCNLVDNQPICDTASSFDKSVLITSRAKISISELDLSQTIYLDTIEASAFSNVPINVTELASYDNYGTGLTSLTFGENNKEIVFGHNAFANLEVDNLTLYSTYITKYDSTDLGDNNFIWDKPFGNAQIKKLDIVSTESDTHIGFDFLDTPTPTFIASDSVFQGINVETLNINEGIATLFQRAGATPFGESTFGTVNLPSTNDFNYTGIRSAESIGTLNLANGIIEIPRNAFAEMNLKDVVIPSTVTTIGEKAFRDINGLTITLKGRTDTTGMTLGAYWSGIATIVYEN